MGPGGFQSAEDRFCLFHFSCDALLFFFAGDLVLQVLDPAAQGLNLLQEHLVIVILQIIQPGQLSFGLDLLFAGLLDWGVAGAAAATVIGQAVSLLFSVEFLRTNRETVGLETGGRLMEVDREILPRLVKLGIPYAVQSAAVNLSMIFVNTLVNQIGVYAASAFGAGTSKEN